MRRSSGDDDSRRPSFKIKKRTDEAEAVFNTPRRRSDYRGYQTGSTDQAGSTTSMSILIGAGIIAAAILLSTLFSALGGRYVGLESPADDTAWLIDRLTGRVYKCQASERGQAACTSELATGSVPDKSRP
jgi:hypothetical protein